MVFSSSASNHAFFHSVCIFYFIVHFLSIVQNQNQSQKRNYFVLVGKNENRRKNEKSKFSKNKNQLPRMNIMHIMKSSANEVNERNNEFFCVNFGDNVLFLIR